MKKSKAIKIIKWVLIVLVAFVALIFVSTLYLQKWLEQNLIETINKEEHRAYDVSYSSFNMNFMLTGFVLEEVSIVPLNKKVGSIITCHVKKVRISGLSWSNVILKRQIYFTEMTFVKPEFELIIGAKVEKEEAPSKLVQRFFGDLLSRVKLNNFSLQKGSFIVYKDLNKMEELGHIGTFDFVAKDIETDSIQWKYPIPFKLREFSSSIKDIVFNLNEYSTISCAEWTYKPQKSKLELKKLSLKLNKHWTYISDLIGKQTDIMSFDLKTLTVSGIQANSQLYGDYDIRAKKLVVDGLVLKDYKNKNKPFVKGKKQSMFSGMVARIPIGLKVDEISIKNTFIAYTEMPKGRNTFGTINLDKLKGSIYNFTTVDSLQNDYKSFEVAVLGKLNGAGELAINLSVPYNRDAFRLKATLENYEMTKLNKTIEPMLGVLIKSGHLLSLDFDMNATSIQSNNKLKMKYNNLALNILDGNAGEKKKRGLVSGVANTMVKDNNLPGDKHYNEADYNTVRDPYRAPFNYIWLAIQDGIPEVVLTDLANELIKSNERRNKKRERKGKKRNNK